MQAQQRAPLTRHMNIDLVRSIPQGLCAACENVKGRWILRAKLSRLARLIHAKNTPLSLLWQSENLAKPEILTPFGICAAAQAP